VGLLQFCSSTVCTGTRTIPYASFVELGLLTIRFSLFVIGTPLGGGALVRGTCLFSLFFAGIPTSGSTVGQGTGWFTLFFIGTPLSGALLVREPDCLVASSLVRP
jgi:hypothetical protein